MMTNERPRRGGQEGLEGCSAGGLHCLPCPLSLHTCLSTQHPQGSEPQRLSGCQTPGVTGPVMNPHRGRMVLQGPWSLLESGRLQGSDRLAGTHH